MWRCAPEILNSEFDYIPRFEEYGIRDLPSHCRDVHQQPVKELDARQGRGDFAALLIDIVPAARRIRVVADHDE